MWVHPLTADSDAEVGGKARGLARLHAAGLPVPDGFVIDDRAFRHALGPVERELGQLGHALEAAARRITDVELSATFVDEVDAWTRALVGDSNAALVVRSSATLEDTPASSGAGILASFVKVSADDLWPAIRAVWASALTPIAAAYGRGAELHVGVIVQRFVAGERVTVYTRPPGSPHDDTVVLQRASAGRVVQRFDRPSADRRVVLALSAERAIGADGGADVELVDTGGVIWVVQARPIVHPPSHAPRLAPPPVLLAPLLADGRRWTWDVAHNPDPLSPAQTSLVEHVERAQIAPWSMRVCAGYLYTTPRDPNGAASATVADVDELLARASAIEARFAQLLDEPADLAGAFERYVEVYAIWANELVPLIANAKRGLTADALVGARPSAVEMTLVAAARGELDEKTAIERLAPLSPTWDVAFPTFGERPDVIRAAIARAAAVDASTRLAHANDDASTRLARAAADLAERDDVWFARAQWMVRAALLRRGHELGVGDDICWLSFEEIERATEADDVRRRASAAKAAFERAGKWAMPLVLDEKSVDLDGRSRLRSAPDGRLRGFGSGARASGRVVRFTSLAGAIAVSHGDVIVTRAITPALAVFVVGCAAIVSETGGPLDHGAAIARELGVPFVVGCANAWSRLRDGTIVTIDHDDVIVE